MDGCWAGSVVIVALELGAMGISEEVCPPDAASDSELALRVSRYSCWDLASTRANTSASSHSDKPEHTPRQFVHSVGKTYKPTTNQDYYINNIRYNGMLGADAVNYTENFEYRKKK